MRNDTYINKQNQTDKYVAFDISHKVLSVPNVSGDSLRIWNIFP